MPLFNYILMLRLFLPLSAVGCGCSCLPFLCFIYCIYPSRCNKLIYSVSQIPTHPQHLNLIFYLAAKLLLFVKPQILYAGLPAIFFSGSLTGILKSYSRYHSLLGSTFSILFSTVWQKNFIYWDLSVLF